MTFTVKDKAAVLAEVAKLQEIRDELTSEVSSLHAQLEQERSKNHASNSEAKPTKQNVNIFLISFKYFIFLLQRGSNIIVTISNFSKIGYMDEIFMYKYTKAYLF